MPYAIYSVNSAGAGTAPTIAVYMALLVCLIPTTIGGLLSAIGIAGMDRVMQHNVLAMSGKAVEAAGDVNTLLLDKTGTITLGSRQAVAFLPASGVTEGELADAAQLSSLADETPEGRSIVVLAKEKYGLRGRDVAAHHAKFIPFSAYTKMSGVDIEGRQLRKGATDAIVSFVKEQGGRIPPEVTELSDKISRTGGTPLAVADGSRLLGIIHLKDIVKVGMKERIAQLRAMGIRSVMVTGDNPLTAAAIASEAGVDDFLAQATPKDKLEYIKKEQAGGRMIAMTGDGTNDAPALAQADVGLAMNTGHDRRPRGRQHGRSRQQPDEADRGRRHRQAAAHHARRADDVLDHERRLEVLRDHSGDVHDDVSGAEQAEHHVPAHAGERRARGGDLQRADHRRAGAAGAARRADTGRRARRRCCAAIC